MNEPSLMDLSGWYGVRCIFKSSGNYSYFPPEKRDGRRAYEERITIWRAKSLEEAIEKAEADALEYAAAVEDEYCGLAQAFAMCDALEEGAEVFSLIRRSTLEPDDYLRQFFNTGTEIQEDA